VRLLIVDPVMAFLPSEVNSHRDQDIRRLLAPLAPLAARVGCAVVLVRHLNKVVGGSPLYRGGGSIGIIGAARSGLLVAKDPGDPDGQRRVLAVTKANLAREAASLAYRLEAREDGVVRVAWLGLSGHSAAGLLAAPTDGDERSARDEAVALMKTVLADGEQRAEQILREAGRIGISEHTLKRARHELGVRARKEGFGGGGPLAMEPAGRRRAGGRRGGRSA
jgi:hypothetical protein